MSDQQPQAPAPGTPEHDTAMAAKFDAANPQAPGEGEQLILGKFKSADDLAKAYAELEKKLGQPQQETPKDPPPVSDGKVDWDAVQKEVTSEEGLTPATREALTKLGIPANVIEGYVSGLQAQQQTFRQTLESEAGGAEQFETIRQWAKANLSEGEKAALQKMVEGGIDSARLAIQTMRQRFDVANGTPPSAPAGGRAPGSSGVGYASTAEMTADMSNPKYASDPAFRKLVEDRLAATTAF